MITDRTVAALRSVCRHPAYVLLFTAGLLAEIFSGNARLIGFPISPDRLLFAAAIVLVLADPDALQTARLRWRTIHTLLIAMIVVVVLSGLAAGTLTSSYGVYALLDRLLVPFLAFALAPVVYATEERRLLLLRALTCLGIYLGATAVFEVIGPHALVVPRYIMDPDVGIQFGRARGPFAESEADGLVLTSCGFAAAVLAWRSVGGWRRAGVVSAALCAFGAFLTETRSIWLGAALGVILVSLAVPRLRRLLPALLATVAVVVLVALAASPALRASVGARAGDQRSLYDRENTNAAAVRVLETHPLTGLGWVEFEQEGTEYVRQAPTYPITTVDIEVHDVFLGRAAELGIPGAALFVLCVLGGPGRALLRPRRSFSGPLTGEPPDAYGWWMVTVGTTVGWVVAALSSPLPYPMPNLLVWVVAGIVITPHLTQPGSTRLAVAGAQHLEVLPRKAPEDLVVG